MSLSEPPIQVAILLKDVRGRRLELVLAPVEEIAERGGGKDLGCHVKPGGDGGELLLVLGREID